MDSKHWFISNGMGIGAVKRKSNKSFILKVAAADAVECIWVLTRTMNLDNYHQASAANAEEQYKNYRQEQDSAADIHKLWIGGVAGQILHSAAADDDYDAVVECTVGHLDIRYLTQILYSAVAAADDDEAVIEYMQN
ncbi:UNVERIFIED_CONTAM: hypothetical protein PYX00_001121 [Menopon gallinae]|uniref:Uncharacterized protein n=1 Tax=Menopon gallinae TaxID=328185 RepID=A0AAW2ID12_9NEOP